MIFPLKRALVVPRKTHDSPCHLPHQSRTGIVIFNQTNILIEARRDSILSTQDLQVFEMLVKDED